MPTTRRSRTIGAPRESVWKIVDDPYHLPRWWPLVQRVEGVDDTGWTTVMATQRGKAVRADYHLVDREPPQRRTWEQEIAGTPFERVFAHSAYELTLADGAAPGQTEVTLAWRQDLRGMSRFGGFMARRAAAQKVDEALEGLASLLDEH